MNQGAYAVVSIRPVYLPIIRHLIINYADEVATQVWRKSRVQLGSIRVEEVTRLFVLPEVKIEIGEESLHPRQEIRFFMEVLSLGDELFKFLHARDLQQKIKVLLGLALQVREATLRVLGDDAAERGTLDVFKLALEVPNGEHEELLEVFQIDAHLAKQLQLGLLLVVLIRSAVLAHEGLHLGLELAELGFPMNHLPVLALADHGLELYNLFLNAPLMKVHVLLNLPLGVHQHEAEEALQLLPEQLRFDLEGGVALVEVLFVVFECALHVVVGLLHRLQHQPSVIIDAQYLVSAC